MTTPRPPHRPVGNAPFGLASTMLRVTVAEMTDSGRNMRGRRLQDARAVLWISVEPGVIIGEVQGSESQPYAVRWSCAALSAGSEATRRQLDPDNPARATRLVPSARDLTAVCSCPDDEMVCKHAVAVLLELADDIGHDPSLIARLRNVAFDARDAVDPSDTALDHRPPPPDRPPRAGTPDAPMSAGPRRDLRLVRGGVVPPPFVDPIGDVLGFPPGARILAGRTVIEPLLPPTPRGPDDLVRDVLSDALEWMQGASPW